MRSVIVAVLVLSGALSAAAADVRTPPILFSVGGTTSHGLGEDSFSPFVRLTGTVDLGRVRLEAAPFYERSRKYTGQGYILGADGTATIVLSRRFLMLGRLDGHRRNGGPFSKDVVLAGGGLGLEFPGDTLLVQVRLTAVTEVGGTNSDNHIRQYQAGFRLHGPVGGVRLTLDITGTRQEYDGTGGGPPAHGSFIQTAFGVGF
jgi:hypothetical protein